MGLGDIFGGGHGIVGNLWDTATGFLTGGATQNAAATVQTNQEQMAFAERMSNSAYQRAVADMRAAGLNPMLAYSQGGASVPSMSLSSPRPGDAYSGFMESAKKVASLFTETKNTLADTDKKDSETSLNHQKEMESSINTTLGLKQAHNEQLRADVISAQAEKESHNARAAKVAADNAEAQSPVVKGRAKIDKQMVVPDSILKRAGEAANVVRPIRLSFPSGVKKSIEYVDPDTGEYLGSGRR